MPIKNPLLPLIHSRICSSVWPSGPCFLLLNKNRINGRRVEHNPHSQKTLDTRLLIDWVRQDIRIDNRQNKHGTQSESWYFPWLKEGRVLGLCLRCSLLNREALYLQFHSPAQASLQGTLYSALFHPRVQIYRNKAVFPSWDNLCLRCSRVKFCWYIP